MHGGLPLVVADPQADPRLAASKSIVAAGIQSAMCAALGKREHRFGLLYADNLSRRGMFTVDASRIHRDRGAGGLNSRHSTCPQRR